MKYPVISSASDRPQNRSILRLLIGLMLVVTAIVLLGDRHWMLELFTHYRPHFASFSLLVATACVVRERYAGGFIALGLAVFHAIVLAVHWVPHNDAVASINTADQSLTRVVSMNLGANNSKFRLISSLIEREKPALVAMTEVTQEHIQNLGDVASSYHVAVNTDTPGFGVGLLSRFPIKDVYAIDLGGHPYPALVAKLVVAGGIVNAIVVHPPPPLSASAAQVQREQFGALKEMSVTLEGELIIMGDFNSTPWSPTFRRMLDGSELRNANIGFSYSPTWPVGVGFLGLPIDHCLVSPGISVKQFRRGARTGSDHLPVVVDLIL